MDLTTNHPKGTIAKHFPLFPHVDFDMIVSEGRWPVGLSACYASEFSRRVAAGVVSYHLQLKSIDGTLKRHFTDVTYPEFEGDRLDFRVSNCINNLVSYVQSSLASMGEREYAPIGTVMCDITLNRMRASFSSILTLANRGFLFETAAVCRMAIEQLAWAMQSFGREESGDVQKLSATRAVTKLKSVYPTTGKYYGWLSEHTHWDYDAHVNVLNFDEDYLKAMLASSRFKAAALSAALIAVDCYVACFEWLYREKISKFRVLEFVNDCSEFKDDRETKNFIEEIISVCQNKPLVVEIERHLST